MGVLACKHRPHVLLAFLMKVTVNFFLLMMKLEKTLFLAFYNILNFLNIFQFTLEPKKNKKFTPRQGMTAASRDVSFSDHEGDYDCDFETWFKCSWNNQQFKTLVSILPQKKKGRRPLVS